MKTKETVQEVQKLTVELTLKEWETVLAIVEQSTAPYIQVKSVTSELIKQLQPQVPKDDKS